MNATSTVLVLGANGRFGQAAVTAFAAAGWRVLAQARRAPACALPAGAQHLDTPLHDTDGLAARAAGASVVVHAVNPIYTRWDAEAMPLARLGMGVAARLSATFMLPGNVYNFGESMPARLTEATPQRPSGSKGRLRVQMEDEMRSRAAGGLRSVVIRAGDFYGTGSGSWLDLAIAKDLRSGKLVYPGPLDMPHAWAYLPDLANAFVAVAAVPVGTGPLFRDLHFAGHTLTGHELLAAVEGAAGELGLAPAGGGFRRGGMPWRLIAVVGVVYPLWRELARMSYLWRVPHALDGAAMQRAVGTLPATRVPVAMRQALLDLGHARASRRAAAGVA